MSVYDPLLEILDGQPTARWNYPAAIGTPLASPGGLGTHADVTYSFMTGFPGYYDIQAHYPGAGFVPMSAAMQAAAKQALAAWASVADIGFTQVADAGAGGEIRFGQHAMTGSGGYAYFPSFGTTYSSGSATILNTSEVPIGGDVYIATQPANDRLQPGQYGYDTLVHEVGHAIGLKHPFEGALTLPDSTDDTAHTVMAYAPPANAGIVTVTGTASGYQYTTDVIYPSGPMLYDIAAVQYLYDANTHTATGDDSYVWPTNARFFQTIWDAGGTDTIDAHNQTLPNIIDLRDGHTSSIGLRQTDAEKRLEIPAFATQAPTPSYDGHDNLAIAFGAVIENAVGGSGQDTLIGNAAANRLDGASGHGEADYLLGGAGNDTYLVDRASDIVTEAPNAGTDTVLARIDGGGFTLGENVENLTLLGATTYGRGNALANAITGDAAANWILGGGGADTLDGGAGNDMLCGQDGADLFTFAPGCGADIICDFAPGSDRIRLSGFSDLTQVADNQGMAFIDLGGGDSIRLLHVAAASLQASDILIA
ncbi:M10 family metallopeptidase C-terminal domain-containing protein [Belnapia sp. T6]|uniref:M10 family metallopeptidase C-terminal domain-containing protein n=1 Tax=Belnapia mucosa TaxID=2804532 RepID=A0ABS1UZ69_9PROT|nr:M10 family metallopeptidase [Belnapia mucosa]MBL6454756.1 M10 family metallopeptidase C-terminal domain-containing protein [Belnapia mucosa]